MKNLYLFIGRSGCGKTTIVNELEKLYGYKSVESYTTRPPRYQNEKGHTFISKEEFDKKNMLAYTLFNGYEYGVDAEMLQNADLYVIDIAGVKILKEKYKDKRLITINIKCDFAIDNMLARGDTLDKVMSRVTNDDQMFAEESAFPFDYVVSNCGPIKDAVDIIHKIIEKEELTEM